MHERSVDVFERRYKMTTGLDANIAENDSVRVLDPATGRVLVDYSKVYSSEVKYDSRGPHHQEFILLNQGGPMAGGAN